MAMFLSNDVMAGCPSLPIRRKKTKLPPRQFKARSPRHCGHVHGVAAGFFDSGGRAILHSPHRADSPDISA
jgi:hypothetical protein